MGHSVATFFVDFLSLLRNIISTKMSATPPTSAPTLSLGVRACVVPDVGINTTVVSSDEEGVNVSDDVGAGVGVDMEAGVEVDMKIDVEVDMKNDVEVDMKVDAGIDAEVDVNMGVDINVDVVVGVVAFVYCCGPSHRCEELGEEVPVARGCA